MSPESSTNWYALEEADPISSPALLVYPDRIDANLRLMIQMVGGDPNRLWPHVKTSKCQSIIERMVAHGIRRFKGATLAELEIAANAGASDLLLAMQPHASMAHRLLDLASAHDSVQTHTLVDCMPSLQMLDQLTQERHQSLTMWACTARALLQGQRSSPYSKLWIIVRSCVLVAGMLTMDTCISHR